ncbi:hypothetical protein SELMODRAFT_416267 [Selaginella moellendorffii]|uniref:Uncharacterized protein n=1 Tax=Selaginella moellendorffii TaxID=88036 RepID=D8RYR4_SELML|nr:hypothetical protein SELMODRAFT_416267 [Selaginella moellendorffii]
MGSRSWPPAPSKWNSWSDYHGATSSGRKKDRLYQSQKFLKTWKEQKEFFKPLLWLEEEELLGRWWKSVTEDEVRSGNSTNSEWLVLQEDRETLASDTPQSSLHSEKEKSEDHPQDAAKRKTGETTDEHSNIISLSVYQF